MSGGRLGEQTLEGVYGQCVWSLLTHLGTPPHTFPEVLSQIEEVSFNEESSDISLPLNASSLLTPDLTFAIQAFVSETPQGHSSLRQGRREWDILSQVRGLGHLLFMHRHIHIFLQ